MTTPPTDVQKVGPTPCEYCQEEYGHSSTCRLYPKPTPTNTLKRYSMKVSYSTGFLPWVESKYDANGAWVMHSDLLSLAERAEANAAMAQDAVVKMGEAEKRAVDAERYANVAHESLQSMNDYAGTERLAREAAEARVRELEAEVWKWQQESLKTANANVSLESGLTVAETALESIAEGDAYRNLPNIATDALAAIRRKA